MAITTNTLQARDIDLSLNGPTEGAFEATPSDANYFEDPDNAGVQVVSKGIALLNPSTEDISIEMYNGRTIVIPGGFLAEGIMHPLPGIVRVNNTDTGASVRVFVWF